MSRGLMEVMLVEERSLGNFTWLRVHHGTPYHPLTRDLEADPLEGFSRGVVNGRDRFAVEV